MYLVRVDFELVGKRNDDSALGAIYSYLFSCKHHGQIYSPHWPVTFSDNIYSVRLSVPERNSLSKKNQSRYAQKHIDYLKECGLKKPKVIIIGKDLGGQTPGKLESNDWFILFACFGWGASPVLGGVDSKPIPLYYLSDKYKDRYDEILIWQNDYSHFDSMQMFDLTGKKFALREMSKIDSSLTKRGLAICDKLTTFIGKPFYYYLYKYNGRSLKKERERFCPGCGSGDWRLEESLFGKFDFKCDKCRLLSNIAWDVR